MRKNIASGLLFTTPTLVLAVVLVLWVGGSHGPEASTAQERLKGDVVMLRCDTGVAKFRVTGYEGSPAASIQRSESCAETLSVLTHAGFRVHDIGHYDFEKKYVLYTLAR